MYIHIYMYTMMSSITLIYYTYSVVLSVGEYMLCMKMIKKAVEKARKRAAQKKKEQENNNKQEK